MRKFLFIAFLFIASFASAQISGNIGGVFYTGSKSATWWQYGKFSVLNIPKLIPSTGIDTASIYYKLSDSSLYIYTGSQWIKVGGSTPNLQAVTDVGNTTTNGAVFNFSEGNVTIGNDGGDPYLSLTATGTGSNVTLTSQNIGIYNNTSSANNSLLLSIPSIYSNRSRTLLFPLTPSTGEKYIPLSIRLNSTTYTANDTGSIELGTIGGSVTSATGTGTSLVNGSSQIKRLKAGSNISLSDGGDSVTIAATGGSGDSSWVSTETGAASNKIGVLLNQNFSSGSLPANWTVGSGLSTSFTGSKLTVTGSPFWGGRAASTYLPWGAGLQYDLYKFPYEKVSMEMTVVPTTKSAGAIIALTQASNGFTFAYKPTIAWDLSNGNTSGKVSYGLDSLVNFVSSYDSTSKISFSANDTLKLFFERDGWRTTAGILNKATGQISYIPFNTVNLYGQGGKWNWIFLNGTYVVTNVKVTVNESEGGVLFAGHSRVAGFGATDETKRYSNLVFNSNYKYFKNVGLPSVSARYFDENGLTDEISTVLKPNKVVFDIGGNDLVDWGGTPAQINVYIDSIGQTFQRNGATDITFVGQFPSSANANILNDSIAALSLRRGWNYVDVDTTIQRDATIIVGQYNYDGAHYSDSGNIIIAGKILAKRGANLLAQMYADTNYTAKFYNFQSLQNAPINILGVKADGTAGLWPNTLPKPNQYIENRYSTAVNTSPNSVAQKETAIHVSSYIKSDSVLWVNSSQGLKMSFADFNSSNTTRSNINITAAHFLSGNIGTMAFDNITGAGNIKIIAPSANKTKGFITGTISGNNNTVFNSNLGTGTLSGSDNIGIGNYSTGLTSGSGNIGIGATSLIGLTTGSRNIAIQISDGINNSYSSNNVSNTIIIGHGGAESITNGDIALGLPPYLGTPNMWIGGRTNYMTEVLMNAAGVVGTNTNGVPFRIRSSRGTGSGKGGSIIFQTWNAGASGTTINSTANTELTIENDSIQVDAIHKTNSQVQIATKLNVAATAGYTVASTDHYIELPDLAGQANRTLTLPTNSGVGRVLIIKNKNSDGGNTWSFNIAVKDKADADVTAIANDQVYHLLWNGTNWVITMLY
jgi:hypothetical protein